MNEAKYIGLDVHQATRRAVSLLLFLAVAVSSRHVHFINNTRIWLTQTAAPPKLRSTVPHAQLFPPLHRHGTILAAVGLRTALDAIASAPLQTVAEAGVNQNVNRPRTDDSRRSAKSLNLIGGPGWT